MKYVIGLDIGTSGAKAILVDSVGDVVEEESCTYDFKTIKDGWYEQDPSLWWEAIQVCIKKIITKYKKEDIVAISMSGQMHSLVMLDKYENVIRPAILWNDTRTSEQCCEIENLAGGKQALLDMVSNPALEGFTAGKLLWIKEHEKDNFEKIHKIMMPKDYIGYCLTHQIYTEKSDASGTLLMDVKKGVWNIGLMRKLGLPKSIFPNILQSEDVVGTLCEEVASNLNLSLSCMVIAGGADNACAALGNGILHKNDALISIGTSGTIIVNVKNEDVNADGTYHLFAHTYEKDLYKMSVMLSSGLSFKWLRKEMLKSHFNYDKLCKEASLSMPGSHGVYFLPYLCGERSPHPNAQASAAFLGLQVSNTQRDMIRAVLEGVGYGCRECLDLMDPNQKIKRLKITGGGAQSVIWTQIITDIIQRDVEVVDVKEGPAYGAALLAGKGSGLYKNIQEICALHVAKGNIFHPNLKLKKVYEEHYQIYKKLYKYLCPAYQDMNQIK